MNSNRLSQIERDVLAFLAHSHNETDKLRIIERIEPDMFFNPVAQSVYRKIVEVFIRAQKIDGAMLIAGLHGEEAQYVVGLDQNDTIASVHYKVAELIGRSRRARLQKLTEEVSSGIKEDLDEDYFKIIEDFIFNEYKIQTPTKSIQDVVEEILAKGEHLNEGESLGFDWIKEVPSLRLKTGGIERGKIYVLGGTKKSGKTRTAVAIIKRLIEQGEHPTFLSMEMREQEVGKLLLSAFSGISTQTFVRRLAPFEVAGFRSSMDKFKDNFYLDTESALSLEKIKAKCWRAAQRGSSVVVIDYLQRMTYPDVRGKNFATIIADTMARLADIARDYNIAMIILSQLNMASENETIADMKFLKDSGGIAEAADAVLMLTNKQRADKGEGKYAYGEEVPIWISIEQRSGEAALIKTVAKLGRLQFFEQTPERDIPDPYRDKD